MNYKNKIITIFLILLFTFNIYSLKKPEDTGKLIFWKIETEKNTVYLLGSIHAANKDLYPLDKNIEDAFDKSDYLVLEANIDEDKFLELMMTLTKKAMYNDGSTLQDKISKSLYKKLESQLKKYSLSIAMVNQMKPWFSAFIINQMELDKLGYSPQYGIDLYFNNKAKDNKEILELESAEFQLDLFNNISEESQIYFLESTLSDLKTLKKSMSLIFDLWVNGDAEGLNDLIFEKAGKERQNNKIIDEFYNALFDQRNINMTEKIERYLQDEKTYFVIAGAGHFLGEKGIINMLKSKGYNVTQVDKYTGND